MTSNTPSLSDYARRMRFLVEEDVRIAADLRELAKEMRDDGLSAASLKALVKAIVLADDGNEKPLERLKTKIQDMAIYADALGIAIDGFGETNRFDANPAGPLEPGEAGGLVKASPETPDPIAESGRAAPDGADGSARKSEGPSAPLYPSPADSAVSAAAPGTPSADPESEMGAFGPVTQAGNQRKAAPYSEPGDHRQGYDLNDAPVENVQTDGSPHMAPHACGAGAAHDRMADPAAPSIAESGRATPDGADGSARKSEGPSATLYPSPVDQAASAAKPSEPSADPVPERAAATPVVMSGNQREAAPLSEPVAAPRHGEPPAGTPNPLPAGGANLRLVEEIDLTIPECLRRRA